MKTVKLKTYMLWHNGKYLGKFTRTVVLHIIRDPYNTLLLTDIGRHGLFVWSRITNDERKLHV